ncbi:hypothetical protein [Cumulibacter manganitolerans]|uniref:hypothetical protein n=1 Tax=Cumulibacter manganitolerans TaxID=1884992 RepID=UPI001E527C32|nr:hypothetical protein [Cumulibacter manganitolerans]
MNLRNRLTTVIATAALAGGGVLLPAVAANAAPAPNSAAAAAALNSTLPVTGTLGDGSAFTGTLSNLTTSVVGGVLQLTGTLTSTALPGGSGTFTVPLNLADMSGSCPVLTLNLGPLDLDLLGLTVHLDEVNLDVTAVPGAGNLLGNLLCAVTHLLDNNGPVTGISALLNRLLTGLGL